MEIKSTLTVVVIIYLFIFERERVRNLGRGAKRERKSQAGSMLSTEPDTGLDPTTLDHDLSRHQELDTQPTEPPKHPKSTLTLRSTE